MDKEPFRDQLEVQLLFRLEIVDLREIFTNRTYAALVAARDREPISVALINLHTLERLNLTLPETVSLSPTLRDVGAHNVCTG